MGSRGDGALIERERELDRLTAIVAAARDGSGRAALIEGDAGIGKTSLVQAAARLAADRDVTVLTARAGELERDYAWGVARQLFDPPVGHAPPAQREALLEGAAALARPALGYDATVIATEETSFSALHGLYWLTVNLAQRGPLMLAIDDLHWADGPSLRFVAHLLPRIGDLPIVVLAATRPPSSEPAADIEMLARLAGASGVETLRPAALSRAGARSLVRSELSIAAEDDFCAACHELSAGNPFLLRGLLADLADEGIAPGADAIDHVRRMTPEAISRSVLLRLARLPASALALARAVAVLGVPADLRRATRLAGLDPESGATAAATLARAGILAGDDPVTYAHPLVRSAVYSDLAVHERNRWHQRAARLLEEERAAPEQLAAHLLALLPAGDPSTVARLRAVAAGARSHAAPEVAAACLRRALAEPPPADTVADVLFELGQVEAVQDPEASRPQLEQALEASAAGGQRAAIALALGNALTLTGRLADAVDVLGRGLAELPAEPSELRSSLAAAQLGAARWERSTQEVRRDLAAAIERDANGGAPLDPRLHGQLAIELTARGTDRGAAVRHARAALSAGEHPATAGTSPVPEAILVLAFADLADEAQRASDAWLAMARGRVWPLGVVLGSTTASLAALYRGRVSDALAAAREAIEQGADMRLAPVTLAFLVEALIERGELDSARDAIAAGGLDGELPLAWATTPLLLARGRLHAAAGDHRRALEDLLETGERADSWGVLNPAMTPWRSSAAVSLAALGERARAVGLASEELDLARRWDTPRAIGVALVAAGIAHGREAGIELLHEAVAVLRPAAAPLEHARALTELGGAARRAGRRAEARDHLRTGLDLAHELGAVALAARAREELIVAGARPRRDALRGRDALTSSELRVARLAADGATNRQIAEALFVTLRTVETHLTSAYAKLGIASRRGLAAALDAIATEQPSG